MSYIEVPVSKLTLSVTYQARKQAGEQPLPDLADSIFEQGLLQNLVVVKAKRGTYEVVAGGRRLQAVQILIKDGRWPADKTVLVLLVAADVALEASITENVQRENMHPADEFEAFNELIKGGKAVEYVAARFAVTPVYVHRRMKLAAVAPELIQAYRANEITLELLMAFTVSDDQDKQMEVWHSLGQYQRSVHIVKQYLRNDAMTACHKLVKYVGLDAYKEAGGTVTCDLFNDSDSGIYIEQQDLLRELATKKLEEIAQNQREQGWSWAETRLSQDHDELRAFGRVYAETGELTAAQQAQIADLEKKSSEASDNLNAYEENNDFEDSEGIDEKWNELNNLVGSFDEQIETIQNSVPDVWPEGMKHVAGVLVSIDSRGSLCLDQGLIRREDRDVAQAAIRSLSNDNAAVTLPAHSRRPAHSEKLVRQLTANKTAIVQAAVASKPNFALAMFVAQLASAHFGTGYEHYMNGEIGLGISTNPESLESHAADLAESRASIELASIRQHWLDELPKKEDGGLGDLLEWALEQDTETLLELQAYLLAVTVKGVQFQESSRITPLDRLSSLLEIRMEDWWTATSASYLSHVSKDRIIEVVTDAAGAEAAAPMHKMKKGEAAAAAELALSVTNWLPEIMTIKDYTQK